MMLEACENAANPIYSAAPVRETSRIALEAWVRALHHADHGDPSGGRRVWAPRSWRSAASACYGHRRGYGRSDATALRDKALRLQHAREQGV